MYRSGIFIVLLLSIIIFQSCATLFPNRNVSESPANSKFITSDISAFYKAFDLAVKDTANAIEIFERYYFEDGSKGLNDFYNSKIHSTERFSKFVISHHDFYRSIRTNVSDIKDLETEILKNFNEFESLYPNAVFPDVYFLIGRFSSNGTISKNGLLIGTEILSRSDSVNTTNWNKDILRISMLRSHIPVTVNHEIVHFNQDRMKGGNTLLWKSIREGSAEFIAELISGNTDGDYSEFEGKELEVWNDFKTDMNKSIWNSWQQASENRPRIAGYWTGYMICKAYYEQVGDKKKAISDILNIKDYHTFYEKSKVDEYIKENYGR